MADKDRKSKKGKSEGVVADSGVPWWSDPKDPDAWPEPEAHDELESEDEFVSCVFPRFLSKPGWQVQVTVLSRSSRATLFCGSLPLRN